MKIKHSKWCCANLKRHFAIYKLTKLEDKSVEEELTMFLYTCFAVSFRYASNVIIKISESQKSRYLPEFQSIESEP